MTMLRKALTAVAVVIVLASMPSPLAAQPKTTTSPAASLSVKEALASWVHDLFKLMAQSIIPLPPSPSDDRRALHGQIQWWLRAIERSAGDFMVGSARLSQPWQNNTPGAVRLLALNGVLQPDAAAKTAVDRAWDLRFADAQAMLVWANLAVELAESPQVRSHSHAHLGMPCGSPASLMRRAASLTSLSQLQDGPDPLLLEFRASLLENVGIFGEALTCLRSAGRLRADEGDVDGDAKIQAQKGHILTEAGQHPEAAQAFRQALEKVQADPDVARAAVQGLAHALARSGQPSRALAVLREARPLFDEGAALFQFRVAWLLGRIAMVCGDDSRNRQPGGRPSRLRRAAPPLRDLPDRPGSRCAPHSLRPGHDRSSHPRPRPRAPVKTRRTRRRRARRRSPPPPRGRNRPSPRLPRQPHLLGRKQLLVPAPSSRFLSPLSRPEGRAMGEGPGVRVASAGSAGRGVVALVGHSNQATSGASTRSPSSLGRLNPSR